MLRVDNIHKSFGALTALGGVSLEVAVGERHAIIGPNGAGKTTLFDVIAGGATPDSGKIRFDGFPVTNLGVAARARLGLGRSFQQNTLFGAMTVHDNLLLAELARHRQTRRILGGRRALREARERLAEIADVTGLTTWLEAPAHALPYGIKRQLEVAIARIGAHRILLLDEPTAGMAPGESQHMQALIAAVSRDLALVVVEHDMDVVFGIADRITVLDRGRAVFSGPASVAKTSAVVRETYLGVEPA